MKKSLSCFAVLLGILFVVLFAGASVFNLTLHPAPTNIPTLTPHSTQTPMPSVTPTPSDDGSSVPEDSIGITIAAPGTTLPQASPQPTETASGPGVGLGTMSYPLTVTAEGYLAATRVAAYLQPRYATWTAEAIEGATLFPALTMTQAAKKP